MASVASLYWNSAPTGTPLLSECVMYFKQSLCCFKKQVCNCRCVCVNGVNEKKGGSTDQTRSSKLSHFHATSVRSCTYQEQLAQWSLHHFLKGPEKRSQNKRRRRCHPMPSVRCSGLHLWQTTDKQVFDCQHTETMRVTNKALKLHFLPPTRNEGLVIRDAFHLTGVVMTSIFKYSV